jgi:hypothetical protein
MKLQQKVFSTRTKLVFDNQSLNLSNGQDIISKVSRGRIQKNEDTKFIEREIILDLIRLIESF